MPRKFTPKVVTANRLLQGDAVWLTPDDTWSTEMHEAQFLDDEAAAEERLLFAQSQPDMVVGAYLADARQGDAGPEPTHFREAFRTQGPSNYHHGKQERSRP